MKMPQLWLMLLLVLLSVIIHAGFADAETPLTPTAGAVNHPDTPQTSGQNDVGHNVESPLPPWSVIPFALMLSLLFLSPSRISGRNILTKALSPPFWVYL
jgi:hypothetical protein